MPISKIIDDPQNPATMKTKFHTILLMIVMAMMTSVVWAQNNQKFSPEQFDAELTAYVIKKAHLTPQEAERLIPLMKQMHSRQRTVFVRIRNTHKTLREHPNDNEVCRKALIERDKLNIELKTIEQKFHNKMMRVVPASKVLAAVEAEDRFFRHAMKQWKNRPPKK